MNRISSILETLLHDYRYAHVSWLNHVALTFNPTSSSDRETDLNLSNRSNGSLSQHLTLLHG
jgi:hypothetical protein